MKSLVPRMLVTILLLVQALMSIGVNQRTILLTPDGRHSCDDGAIAAAHSCDHHPPRASQPTNANLDCAINCCACPHVHVEGADRPIAPGEDRTIKDSVPLRTCLLIAAADSLSASLDARIRALNGLRDHEENHPPPPGLRTTILRI